MSTKGFSISLGAHPCETDDVVRSSMVHVSRTCLSLCSYGESRSRDIGAVSISTILLSRTSSNEKNWFPRETFFFSTRHRFSTQRLICLSCESCIRMSSSCAYLGRTTGDLTCRYIRNFLNLPADENLGIRIDLDVDRAGVSFRDGRSECVKRDKEITQTISSSVEARLSVW